MDIKQISVLFDISGECIQTQTSLYLQAKENLGLK